jgi:hypothetical protein
MWPLVMCSTIVSTPGCQPLTPPSDGPDSGNQGRCDDGRRAFRLVFMAAIPRPWHDCSGVGGVEKPHCLLTKLCGPTFKPSAEGLMLWGR